MQLGRTKLENYHFSLQSIFSDSNKIPLLGIRNSNCFSSPADLLAPELIESLQWCGEQGYIFQFQVDCSNPKTGGEMLSKVGECITLVRAEQTDQKLTKFVIGQLFPLP